MGVVRFNRKEKWIIEINKDEISECYILCTSQREVLLLKHFPPAIMELLKSVMKCLYDITLNEKIGVCSRIPVYDKNAKHIIILHGTVVLIRNNKILFGLKEKMCDFIEFIQCYWMHICCKKFHCSPVSYAKNVKYFILIIVKSLFS